MPIAFDEQWLAILLARGDCRLVPDSSTAPPVAPATRRPVLDVGPAAALEMASPLPSQDAPRDRYRSKTERRYAALLDGERRAGRVGQWYYEPCKGLYLAPKLSYTPDFLVMYCDGRSYEFHEVKGAYIREKDWNKAKMAAALYPVFRFVLAQWTEGAWHWKTIPAY